MRGRERDANDRSVAGNATQTRAERLCDLAMPMTDRCARMGMKREAWPDICAHTFVRKSSCQTYYQPS